MPGEKPMPLATLFLGALALLVLGVFLFALVARDRFEAGYLGLFVVLATAAFVMYRR
jgi:hypothetical protein